MTRLALALILGLAAVASASKGQTEHKITPVQKVIQMLDDMLAKGKKEKQEEITRFMAYKVFCTQTRSQKEKSIKEGNELIQELKATIVKSDADAAMLAKEISAHDTELATWGEEKAQHDAVREKEHADFMVTQKEYTDSMDAVKRAEATIKAQPQSVGQAAFLQLESNLREEKSLIGAKKIVMSFLQQDPNVITSDSLIQSQGPQANAFEAHTGGVLDMVNELGEKFEDEKSKLEKSEMEKQNSFQLMVQDLEDQIENGQEARDEKAATKKDRESASADAAGDLADTQATLAEDTKTLKDLNTECQAKAEDYEKRQVLRAGEIEAVSKAIEIMSSDKVSGGTQHLPSLVQQTQGATALVQLSRTTTNDKGVLQSRVALFLKSQAKRSGSRVLSLLAAKAAADPFKKITKMIQDMIDKLMQEATEEAEHKGFCDTEMKTNEQTRVTKGEEVSKLTAESDQLTADIAKLGEEVTALAMAIAEIDAAMAKATADRTAEKEKNTATIADAKVAGEATQQALQVLKDFYEGAAGATALTQTDSGNEEGGIQWDSNTQAILRGGKDRDTALAQLGSEQPGAPETFDKPYTGMGGSNTGVVGMLEVIASDFERLETETTEGEAEAARIYKKFSDDSSQDKAVKTTDMNHKSGQKTEKAAKLNAAKKDLAASQEELDAALAYFEKLKPSCVDAGVSYEERVMQRKEEIESLKEALQILEENGSI